MTVVIYDTTLRDGTQGEGVQLSVADKLTIAALLDELGVGYIEGGWPGSNPRDEAFFEAARKLHLKHAKLTAFGSTRRSGLRCEDDPNLSALLRTGVPTLTIFGKSWKLQATDALRISPEENLELIEDSVRYLKARTECVIFDAEHFFDGYADDPEYALKALEAAQRGGADYLALCDTNGGALTHDLQAAVAQVRTRLLDAQLGIHTHNDSEMAVANALAAVCAGAVMVQGTVNGYGERCGNANLISIIPALCLKMGIECIPRDRLNLLSRLAHTVDELSNRAPWDAQPYIGRSAFAHKGGVHVDAVRRNSRTYEHIEPETVGNQRRILVSDLSGKSNVFLKAREYGIDLDANAPQTKEIVKRLKRLENQGYQFEGAEASFRLIMDEALGKRPSYFRLLDFDVHIQVQEDAAREASSRTIAELEVEVGGVMARTAADGEGPIHAMDRGLRTLIDKFYPTLQDVRLVDYKVRVLSSSDGTGSVVRVLIQSSDGDEVWATVGVSPNIIEASWRAVVDALEYKLVKDGVTPHAALSGTIPPGAVPSGTDAPETAQTSSRRGAMRRSL